MADAPTRRPSIAMAVVLLVAAAAVLVGLVLAASRESQPDAWSGRWLGFAAVGGAVAVAVAAFAVSKPGDGHYWGVVGALALGGLLAGAYSYKPQQPQMGLRAKEIPRVIGQWSGRDSEVSDEVKRILMTDDIIQRLYQRGRQEINLLVVFGKGSRKVAHPPEQCDVGAGYELEEITPDSFPTATGRTVNAKRLLETRGGQLQLVIYTYKAGDLYTGNFARQQFHVILSNLLMRRGTPVALIKLSTSMQGVHQKDDATALLKQFASELFPEIDRVLRQTLPDADGRGRP